MKRYATILLLIIVSTAVFAESETVHNFSFSFSAFSDMHDLESVTYESALIWEPEVYAYRNSLELYFYPRFWYPIESTVESYLDINEFKLSYYPNEKLTIELGQYLHDSTFAAFFSQTAFFRVTDYPNLIKGNLENTFIPTWLVDLSWYSGAYYLRSSFEPFREDIPFFSPDSPWFPNFGFPEEIASPFASDGKIELESVTVTDPEPQDTLTELKNNIGGALEFGGSTGTFDFLFIYYSGRDTTPLYTGEVILKGLHEDYRVELHPVNQRISALGTALRTSAGPFILYTEGSYIFNKTFLKDTYYSTPAGFETETYTSPFFGFTMGGRFEWWKANLIGTAEYTNGNNLEEHYGTVMPFFNKMALGNLTWLPLNGLFEFSMTGIISVVDASSAMNTSIKYSPSKGQVTFTLSTPLFFGDENSDFGQYKDLLHPTFSAELSF